jgi:hypothetical protein
VSSSDIHSAKMGELCALYVVGELSIDETEFMTRHLPECEHCRRTVNEFEKLCLVDLAALAVERAGAEFTGNIEAEEEDRLLNGVIQRARDDRNPQSIESILVPEDTSACRLSWRERLSANARPFFAAGGWAIAAVMIVGVVGFQKFSKLSGDVKPTVVAVLPNKAPDPSVAELSVWKDRLATAEVHLDLLEKQLEAGRLQVQTANSALSKAESKYVDSLSKQESLQAQMEAQDQKAQEQMAELATARTQLADARNKEVELRAEMQNVEAALRVQRDNDAAFHRVAANVSTGSTTSEQGPTEAEAKELFGARDLHIVDVYDVDHSGKASRTFGRVYYVNHKLLLFYAFDLAEKGQGRKAVGFQAWGFRQPNSTTPENLGLFYVDDAKADRWVLRVSDPKILARIDTVFVTIEPNGGSASPKGRQLLFASLADSPNHP